jgi:hypothetical protein
MGACVLHARGADRWTPTPGRRARSPAVGHSALQAMSTRTMGAVWREIAYTARSAMCQLASNGIEGCLRRLGVIDLCMTALRGDPVW